MLDIGCGVGAFLRLVAERGARPFGLDASEALLDARSPAPARTPTCGSATWRRCPTRTTRFDLVTGFNSFFFANDIVAALREAGRVAKPGAPVVIQVWGPHERNDLEAMKADHQAVLPAAPGRTRRPSPTTPSPACSRTSPPGPVSTPESSVRQHLALRVPATRSTLRRALVAPAGIAVLVGPDREERGQGRDRRRARQRYRTADGELPAPERRTTP